MINEDKKSKKIRKGDKVIAISGNNRGQVGDVLSVIGAKAVVQGLNVKKKHVKATENNPRGGIIELEKPMPLCKLKVCVENDLPVKLKIRSENGKRQLVYKRDGQEVLYRSVKKS